MTDTLLRFRGAMGNSPLQGHAATPPIPQQLNASAPPFRLGSPMPAAPAPAPINDDDVDSASLMRILRDATAAADSGVADSSDKIAVSPQPPAVPASSFALGSSFSKNPLLDDAHIFGNSAVWGSTTAYPTAPHTTPSAHPASAAASYPNVSPSGGGSLMSGNPAAIMLVRNQHGVFLLQPALGSPATYAAPPAMQLHHHGPLSSSSSTHHHHQPPHHAAHPHHPGGAGSSSGGFAGRAGSTSLSRDGTTSYRSPQASGMSAPPPPPPTYMTALRDCSVDGQQEAGVAASNIPMGVPAFALNRSTQNASAAIPLPHQRNNGSPALGASPPPYGSGTR